MTTTIESRAWPRWLPQSPPLYRPSITTNNSSSSTATVVSRADVKILGQFNDGSPPAISELPELDFSGNLSTPSGSSSSHEHQLSLPRVYVAVSTPTLHLESSKAEPKRTPNKLRKSRYSRTHPSSQAIPLSFIPDEPIPPSNFPVPLTFPTRPLSSISTNLSTPPSSLRYIPESYRDTDVYLYRSTSSPTVSMSTERATVYSISSRAPLLRDGDGDRDTRFAPVPPPTRKLTKPRKSSGTHSLYQTVQSGQSTTPVTNVVIGPPAAVRSEEQVVSPLRRRSTISFSLNLKRWKSHVQRPAESSPPPLPPPSSSAIRNPSQRLSTARQNLSDQGVVTPIPGVNASVSPSSPVAARPSVWLGPPMPEHLDRENVEPLLLAGSHSDIGHDSAEVIRTSQGSFAPRTLLDPSPLASRPLKKMFTLEADDSSENVHIDANRYDVYYDEHQSSLAPRPRLVRRHALSPTEAGSEQPPWSTEPFRPRNRRRWSLAMAMNDEGLTDELFIAELEKIRYGTEGDHPGELDGYDSDEDDDYGYDSVLGHGTNLSPVDLHNNLISPLSRTPSTASVAERDVESSAAWPTALRALLTTRDMIRTEKNYLNSLHVLLNTYPYSSTQYMATILPWPQTPPPSVMFERLRFLIRISTLFLQRMQEDPSVWGVASAFVMEEEDVERAFVEWCSGIGAWYTDEPIPKTRRRLSRTRFSTNSMSEEKDSPVSKRNSFVGIKSSPRSASTLETGNNARIASVWRRSASSTVINTAISSHHSAPSSPTHSRTFNKVGSVDQNGKKILSVRELGILPVQRILRYKLMFRDLLKRTPSTSPAHPIVEHAVQIATRIADRCNQSQRNDAFLSK